MPFHRDDRGTQLATLAGQGVFLGTSSWKDPGWQGMLYNRWQDMPPVAEQLAVPESRTTPDFCGARFLLKPGRAYEEAVRRFRPYDRVQEVNAAGRAAGARLIRDTAVAGKPRRTFIYVNNRFEGNALETIAAMLDQAQAP